MTMYVKINETEYPIISIETQNFDREWGNRESKAVTLEMTAAAAKDLFCDDIKWSVIANTKEQEEYDYSDYSKAGDVIDHRDGTVTVKMGKPTDKEILNILTGE